jgi:hypothetical protein
MQAAPNKSAKPHNWLEVVAEQIATLRFGVVQIVVHDGRVVQIEKTEKVRLDKPANDTN